ncbi:radical SAM protein [Thermoflexus sp.]|uniref:radical SAM protein n=1 Tax=Thermoflexus sp. TaxID=1969742 RepID=UPI00175BE6E2|nr:radical SAM protein [Thermoflexus sp.]
MRYTERPLLIYWELTRACDLACHHCRAEAIPWRDPRELSTAEGFALLDRLTAFGEPRPHLVLTGGDPLKRPDLFELIAEARRLGFPVALTPSGTYALTEDVIARLKAAGIWMLALSLDGSTAERHDALRGVPGSFAQTVRAAQWAVAAGLPLQINTLVCAETMPDVPAIAERVVALGARRWSLFFLIPTGRGRLLREISPEESEQLMHWLIDLAPHVPFEIKTTEAPHYRRVLVERAGGRLPPAARRGFGVRDGNGVMFISHIGEIYPSGFLPIPLGHVRREDPVAIYREHPLFRALRDPDALKGKCGRCPFRAICGGSRARAYAHTGDPLESDPLCPYLPA